MFRLALIPLAMLTLVVAAVIWSGAAKTERPANFVFINRGDIGTLDPNSMSWLQDLRLAYALWEGLYTLDAETLDPIPGCADRVDISPDKTVYTFHIRPLAKWCNADDLVATDFVFAWRRMLEQPGDYTYLFHYIKGAKAYQETFARHYELLQKKNEAKRGGKEFSDAVPPLPDFLKTVAVEPLSPKTLRVTLEHPVTFFPALCAFPSLFPMHEGSMRPFASPDPDTGRITYDARFTRPPNLVGNGSHRLESWEFHKRLRMVASNHYWDRKSVKSPVIDMLSFSDPRTAFLKYDTGAVDWLAEVSAEDAGDLRKINRPDLHIFPGFGTYFYSVNCQPKFADGRPNPLADPRVRQALSMAIDKNPIVKNVARLGQPIATTFVPPGVFPNYKPPRGLSHDPQRARQLLAEAGYPGGKNFPKLSILFNKEGDHRFIAQIVRKQWLDVLGIDMEMGGVEIKTFRTRLHDKQYAIARASWIGDYADVSTFTDTQLSDSENNDSGWANEKYDALCRQAAREADVPRRLVLLSQAEQILLDEAPIIPLYNYVNAYLYRDDVKGISLNPRNMVIFKAVEARRRR